ncbi:hypothetical protein [Rhodospirillum sp. A1_3_36]|uniref:hypothetical protein n=1 Tax=Rhodospirillum sp. A1_3_36 TaxID=3391666 RepID=UPI0039A6EDF2
MVGMIRFLENQNKESKDLVGEIFLEEFPETFVASSHDWSVDDYVRQWRHAVRHSLFEGEISCFITNFSNAFDHPKKIDVFTIIPEARVHEREACGREEKFKDFYITNSFLFITSNPSEHMRDQKFFENIKSAYGNYFPIYPFFSEKLEVFYLYLGRNIQGISNWKVSSEKLASLL